MGNSESYESLPAQAGSYLTSEYAALRAEMLKRIEIQHQLILAALVASGTFLSISVQPQATKTILLIYPFLATFLSVAWAQNDIRIRQIGLYVFRLEELFLGTPCDLGWEHMRLTSRLIKRIGSLSVFAARGILLGTEGLALLLFLLSPRFHKTEVGLLVLDVVAIVFTAYVLRHHVVIPADKVRDAATEVARPSATPP